MVKFFVFIGALISSYGAGLVGSFFTYKEVTGTWYQSIRPAITPPDWVFPVVWNLLFLLIAISFYYSLISSKTRKERIKVGVIYGANLVLNSLWSILFFGAHNPLLAFINLCLIILTLILAMSLSYKIDKKATFFLVPYLLWLIFAGILNYLAI